MEEKKARVTPAAASAVADLYLYLARLRSCSDSALRPSLRSRHLRSPWAALAATVEMDKGDDTKSKGGESKKRSRWNREVRPAICGVAVVFTAPPSRPGSCSNQIDSNANRVLTRAVRIQIEF